MKSLTALSAGLRLSPVDMSEDYLASGDNSKKRSGNTLRPTQPIEYGPGRTRLEPSWFGSIRPDPPSPPSSMGTTLPQAASCCYHNLASRGKETRSVG